MFSKEVEEKMRAVEVVGTETWQSIRKSTNRYKERTGRVR